MKKVLLVNNDPVMKKVYQELLDCRGGFIKTLTAVAIKEAAEILHRQGVDLILISTDLPNNDGLKLAAYCSKKFPDISIILLARKVSKALSETIKPFANTTLIDLNHDINLLGKRVTTELEIEYGGKVTGVSISSFLQMLALDRACCTLKVTAKKTDGFLWLKFGELIAASCNDLRGRDAALHILSWQNVTIDINYAPFNKKSEIEDRLIMMIIESGKKFDDTLSLKSYSREDERYDISVTIDSGVNEITRQCLLRDISLSGAYIETDQMLDKGQLISLVLISPVSKAHCPVDSRVVHSDQQGAGLSFELKDDEQRHLIQMLIDSSMKSRAIKEQGQLELGGLT